MNERLDAQDRRLQQHSEKIQQLEKWDKDKHLRIRTIEENDIKQEDKLKEIQGSYLKLENTILAENKETRTFFQSNMNQLWDLTKSRDAQIHDTKKMSHEITKTRIERLSDIFFKLAGTGGILYLIVQAIIK